MNNRTIATISLFLIIAVVLFHQTAKKQLSESDVQLTTTMNQPRAWQGRRAPDFTAELLNRETIALSDQVGKKVIILNFFATWCGPCKEEMPELLRFAAQHKDDPLLFIGINADEPESAVRDFVREYNVSYPVAIDRGGKLRKAFSVRSFPTTVLIGVDGAIHLYETGSIRNADVAFDALIAPDFASLRAGTGITRENFLSIPTGTAGPTGAVQAEEKPGSEKNALTGRAKIIADKMSCPCGCSHTLRECTCKTAQDIRSRLGKQDPANRTDEDVIRELNREFCMK